MARQRGRTDAQRRPEQWPEQWPERRQERGWQEQPAAAEQSANAARGTAAGRAGRAQPGAAAMMRRRGNRAPRRLAGFTLLEVLIAVAIFVLVGMLAMTGYNELTTQSERIEGNAKRTREIQAAVLRIGQDFATAEPRAVREPLGSEVAPAIRAAQKSEVLVEFTHSGWSNPAGVPRPTLQRVAYRMQDNKLYRDYWAVLDRTMTDEPTRVMLLERVKSVTLRYMGADRDWKDQWPPLGYSGRDTSFVRPLAVEITLELEDWGKIVRL